MLLFQFPLCFPFVYSIWGLSLYLSSSYFLVLPAAFRVAEAKGKHTDGVTHETLRARVVDWAGMHPEDVAEDDASCR